jgi:hypothetical protein
VCSRVRLRVEVLPVPLGDDFDGPSTTLMAVSLSIAYACLGRVAAQR